jgi:peptide/nickel transport system substrate-binding protein
MAYQGNPGFEESVADPGLRLLPGGGRMMDGTSALLFNLTKAPLNDVRVRRAIALGFDRPRMTDLVSKGRDLAQVGPIPNDHPLNTPIPDPYPFDPVRANALLEEAGYPKDARGVRFTLRLTFIPTMRATDWVAEYLRFELQRTLGIEIDVQRPATLAEWAKRLVEGDFDLELWFNISYGDPLTGIHRLYRTRPEGPVQFNSNPANYSNPEVDRLLDQAAAEPDPARRKAIYAEFQRLVLEDLPLIPISRFELHTIYHRDLEGLEQSPWGAISPFDQLHWRRAKNRILSANERKLTLINNKLARHSRSRFW